MDSTIENLIDKISNKFNIYTVYSPDLVGFIIIWLIGNSTAPHK